MQALNAFLWFRLCVGVIVSLAAVSAARAVLDNPPAADGTTHEETWLFNAQDGEAKLIEYDVTAYISTSSTISGTFTRNFRVYEPGGDGAGALHSFSVVLQNNAVIGSKVDGVAQNATKILTTYKPNQVGFKDLTFQTSPAGKGVVISPGYSGPIPPTDSWEIGAEHSLYRYYAVTTPERVSGLSVVHVWFWLGTGWEPPDDPGPSPTPEPSPSPSATPDPGGGGGGGGGGSSPTPTPDGSPSPPGSDPSATPESTPEGSPSPSPSPFEPPTWNLGDWDKLKSDGTRIKTAIIDIQGHFEELMTQVKNDVSSMPSSFGSANGFTFFSGTLPYMGNVTLSVDFNPWHTAINAVRQFLLGFLWLLVVIATFRMIRRSM